MLSPQIYDVNKSYLQRTSNHVLSLTKYVLWLMSILKIYFTSHKRN